jgi:methyl coenzyme M reductase subunit C
MIIIIKLSSGDTLLGKQFYKSNDKITITDPLKMEFINFHDAPAMHSTFWIPLSSKEEISVDIDMSHVIISVEAPEDLEDFYKKSIESIKKIEDGAEHKKRIIEEKVKNAIKGITRTSNTIHTVH